MSKLDKATLHKPEDSMMHHVRALKQGADDSPGDIIDRTSWKNVPERIRKNDPHGRKSYELLCKIERSSD